MQVTKPPKQKRESKEVNSGFLIIEDEPGRSNDSDTRWSPDAGFSSNGEFGDQRSRRSLSQDGGKARRLLVAVDRRTGRFVRLEKSTRRKASWNSRSSNAPNASENIPLGVDLCLQARNGHDTEWSRTANVNRNRIDSLSHISIESASLLSVQHCFVVSDLLLFRRIEWQTIVPSDLIGQLTSPSAVTDRLVSITGCRAPVDILNKLVVSISHSFQKFSQGGEDHCWPNNETS